MSDDFSDPGLMRQLEAILPESSATFYEGSDVKLSGIEVVRFGSTVGLVDFWAGRLNRVAGFGVFEPASEATLDEIVHAYRSRGIKSFFIWMSPTAESEEVQSWLTRRGFKHDRNAARIARRTADAAKIETDLRIARATPDDKEAIAQVSVAGFNSTIERGRIIADSIDRPDWRWYIAWDGDKPVGAGGLYVREGIGWLGYGSTIPDARKRGAQSAIIAARVAAAREMGCDWVTSETAEDTPEAPVSSYHNMIRNVFELVHIMKAYTLNFDT